MNYFEFYPGDYSRDTRHCSLAEHGAFLLLLSAYYATEKPLPADYVALYRICSAMTPEEQAAVRTVADAFFPLADDGLRHNKRADEEIPKALARIETARANGGRGGRPPKKPKENPAGFDPVNQDETQPVSGSKPSGVPAGKAPQTPYTKKEQEQDQEPPHTPRKRGDGGGRRLQVVKAEDRFAEFWQAYPRKVAKPAAEKAWRKVAGDADAIMAGLRRQSGCDDWQREGGRFIPHPATWLNGRRWEDDAGPVAVASSGYFKSAEAEDAFDRQMREIMAVAL